MGTKPSIWSVAAVLARWRLLVEGCYDITEWKANYLYANGRCMMHDAPHEAHAPMSGRSLLRDDR